MTITNLLKETLLILDRHGKTIQDVSWVGTREGYLTWEEFANKAANTNYDLGYGMQRVRDDLVVAGDGWWLERAEYDGLEWWSFKNAPVRPSHHGLGFGLLYSN